MARRFERALFFGASVLAYFVSLPMLALGQSSANHNLLKKEKTSENNPAKSKEDNSMSPSSSKQNRPKKMVFKEVDDNPSSMMRKNKVMMFTFSLLGFDYRLKPFEISAGYFLDQDIVLGLRYQRFFPRSHH